MATEHKGQQGTGQHKHKSTEEPYPHTREAGTEHGGRSGRAEEKGHSSESHRSESHSSGSRGSEHRTESHSGRGEADDLKEREYRDKDGNVHHHTRTSQAMQDKK